MTPLTGPSFLLVRLSSSLSLDASILKSLLTITWLMSDDSTLFDFSLLFLRVTIDDIFSFFPPLRRAWLPMKLNF